MYEEYMAVVSNKICKGPKGDEWQAQLGNTNGGEVAAACFLASGNQEAHDNYVAPLPSENAWEYRSRAEETWDVLDYSEGFVLKDHDWVVWAWSSDGTELPNNNPMLDGGNVTTGFLIKASDDYPTVWLSHDPGLPSGIHPLNECTNSLRRNEFKLGRLVWVFRQKEV
jgi:hypothetical protein